MRTLPVHVWSDIACPWCFVGKRRLEAALRRFEHADAVRVRWRAFELAPDAPTVEPPVPYSHRLAAKYGTSLARGEAMIATMLEAGRGEGLALDFGRIRPGNTFDAHRLGHLASVRGLGDAAQERLLRAYLEEGEAIGDRATLARLGVEVGLDEREVAELLAGDRFGAEVRSDEQEARRRGITGVPCFVLADRWALSGAQPATELARALDGAWRELARAPAPGGTAGEACGPEGCA